MICSRLKASLRSTRKLAAKEAKVAKEEAAQAAIEDAEWEVGGKKANKKQEADAAKKALDAQKVAIRMARGPLEQKTAITTANLQLSGLRCGKQLLQAQRLCHGLEIVQQRVRVGHAFSFCTNNASEAV